MKYLKILFLVNTKSGINTYKRAISFAEYIQTNSSIEVTFLYRKNDVFRDFFNFTKQILRNRFSLVHVFEPYLPTFPFLIFLLRLKGVRIIYDSGDIHYFTAIISKGRYLLQVFDKVMELIAYNISNNIIVRGGSARQVIKDTYGIPLNKIVWIPDGVDLTKFNTGNSLKCKSDLSLTDNFVIGYASSIRKLKIGSMDSGRGWEILEVAKMMIDSGRSNIKILVVGDGPGLTLLKERSKLYGLNDKVLFTGYVSEEKYPIYIKSMDVGFYQSINHPA